MVEVDKLLCGDTVEVMRGFEDECIDEIVLSPPYDDVREYGGYTFNYQKTMDQCFRVLKPGGVMCWVIDDQRKDFNESGTKFRQIVYGQDIGFKILDTMGYEKIGLILAFEGAYMQCFELIIVFLKGDRPKYFDPIMDRYNKCPNNVYHGTRRNPDASLRPRKALKTKAVTMRSNLWRYHVGHGKIGDQYASLHPAPMPERLARDLIISWSAKGDIVLDPLMGGGTVPKVAKKLQRHFIGIDCNQEYLDIAQKRLDLVQSDGLDVWMTTKTMDEWVGK